MVLTDEIETLRRIRDDLRNELACVGDLRPGTLVEIARKCGKPGCRCARPGNPAHRGWALARSVGGRRVNRGVPRDALELTRAHIAEHARFKELARRFVDANEALCRARLKASGERENATKGDVSVR
ncbi:MAG: hypothetical protein OXI79_08810 [Gammaproteobacteria bacterium]|nr:hypothetical protein [Gammaproteobacteria bacterium]